MHPWQIVTGHMLAMFTVVFLQMLMLVLFGQWVLKVDYLRQPLAIFLVAVMLGFWVSSIGLLIGVLRQGGTAGDPVQHDRHVPVLRPGRDLVPARIEQRCVRPSAN